MDERYLDERIKHIADEDLFSSMKLSLPGLEGVKSAVHGQDYLAAGEEWRKYLLKHLEKRSRPDEINRRGDIDWNDVTQEADLREMSIPTDAPRRERLSL